MAAYYNENDPKMAAWLRALIAEGLIADGEVDTRSIIDVRPSDLAGFVQSHFFAGIGGWSYALRLAGWPDERPVWTGSCPCQPFSDAGKKDGANDSRHLWPTWLELIRECLPDVVFGEQVASADGLGWFDRVSTDLEEADYAVGAADLCAASVGAFHIRQRVWFVADNECTRLERAEWSQLQGRSAGFTARRDDGDVADTEGQGRQRLSAAARQDVSDGAGRGETGQLAESDGWHEPQERTSNEPRGEQSEGRRATEWAGAGAASGTSSVADAHIALSGDGELQRGRRLVQPAQDAPARFWDAADWIACRDGKARPIEPGSFPLAHGVPARVGRLRGYGNAIVPQVAAEFVRAYMETQ